MAFYIFGGLHNSIFCVLCNMLYFVPMQPKSELYSMVNSILSGNARWGR